MSSNNNTSLNATLNKKEKKSLIDWRMIEKRYKDNHTINVINAMMNLGDKNIEKKIEEREYKAVGEEIYKEYIRAVLEKLEYVKGIKKNKKEKKKVIKKKEIIRMENTKKMIEREIEKMKLSFKMGNEKGYRSNIVEIRLATYIHYSNMMLRKETKKEEIYEMIIGIEKTLENIKGIENISEQSIKDMKETSERLKEHSKFSYVEMFGEYPRLSISTKYDKVFPKLTINAYKSQEDLIKIIKEEEKYLCLYNTMIGSGKTTFIVAISKYIESIRVVKKVKRKRIRKLEGRKKEEKTTKKNTQVLFICEIEPVRQQVARLAYNSEIAFGMGIMENDYLKIINNENCKSDQERVLIISDLEAGKKILEKGDKYILFFDEPTLGADRNDSKMTKKVVEIIKRMPEKTILSSATLPKEREIKEIVEDYKEKHKGEVRTINFRESLIGCEMRDIKGEIILPHNNCENERELKKVIETIESQIFIDRLYTAKILYEIVKKMTEALSLDEKKEIEGLEEYFGKVENLTQHKIQEKAIEILKEIMKKKESKKIKKICEPIKKKEEIFKLNKIFTKDANKFKGPTLITTKDPIKFVEKNTKELLKGNESITKMIKKYKTEIINREAEISKLSFIINPMERSKKEQEIRSMNIPKIEYPKEKMINSYEHIMKYAGEEGLEATIKRRNIEKYPLEMNIPEWMYQALFSGIGIYKNDNSLPKEYKELILNLASTGELMFLVSDDSICYGANYPLLNVIITDGVVNEHSISTIFQLAGRAGRVGTSWIAYCYVEKQTANRIKKYIKRKETTGIKKEAKNILSEYRKLKEEDEREKQREEEELEEWEKEIDEDEIKITINDKKSKLEKWMEKKEEKKEKEKEEEWTIVENKNKNKKKYDELNDQKSSYNNNEKVNRFNNMNRGYRPPHMRNNETNNNETNNNETNNRFNRFNNMNRGYRPPHMRNIETNNNETNNRFNRW